MPAEFDSIFLTAPARLLLARELAMVEPLLAGIYGQHGVYIRPASLATAAAPGHLLGSLSTLETLTPQRLGGAVNCAPTALPFLDDSLKLVLLQHATELVAEPTQFAAEIARVLAPEGVVLILAFNPYGAWRPWLTLQQRRQSQPLHFHSALRWEKHLAEHKIDVMQTRYLGALWPRAKAGEPSSLPDWRWLAHLRGAYLILARKRRSTLTPLRLRLPRRERAVAAPYLAPGARRGCA